MLEDSVVGMEKKSVPRQTAVTKSNGAFERKNDPISANKYQGRSNKKRDNGYGRGTLPQPDVSSRRPLPQKSRTALDKRPRQRSSIGYRQREEVVEAEGVGKDAHLQQGFSKKGNLNHLLNFQYAVRENVVGSTQRLRARRPRAAYNKERYLQANCQFVVKDSGNYSLQATDPDALVDWDLVEQVRTFSHEQASCPICLQVPAAGKITKCGHVYCWACILHYLSLDDRSWRKCPICYESVHKSDLRSVKVLEKQEQKVGHTIILQLMKRERGSTYAVPLTQWEDRQGCPQNLNDQVNTEYAKVLVASAQQIHTSVIEEERRGLAQHMESAEPSEVCFIELALEDLNDRERALKGQTEAGEGEKEGASGGDSTTREDAEGSFDERANTTSAAIVQPDAASSGKLSFHGSKTRKQYADAFEDLEQWEKPSILSTQLSVSEKLADRESTDSSLSLSSSSLPDQDTSSPVPVFDLVTTTENEPNFPADSTLAILPPELAEEATMTTEEAIEQLTLPVDFDKDDSQIRRTRNHSKRAFYFYQANDGQHIYLHSINARCIDHQYGSLENGPRTITAKIVAKEITFMTENIRQRLRYLSHLPLTCEFQVVEVQLEPPVISEETLNHFAGDLKKRAQHRQRMKKEDKLQARRQRIEEKKLYGIYPEVKLALDSPDHFPAPLAQVEERRRLSSVSDTVSLSSPPSFSSLELNVNVVEFVPKTKADFSSPESHQFSFAAALKQPAPPAWGKYSAHPSGHSVDAHAACAKPEHHSEDSDNEDHVHAPVFQNSFSDAISVALKALDVKDEGVQRNGKKKKKEKKLLFSTSMMRR